MHDVVIKTEHISKSYRLGAIGTTTLREDLQSRWARLRGKPDPNLRIGKQIPDRSQSFLALDDINLTVNRADTLGIIGANGAGKSTLLKILSRITAPTSGQAWIRGRISSILEIGTGFHRELTGRENIYLNGAILGMTRAEVDKHLADIIQFSECGAFIDTPVKRYSSGMYVKLAFAVAAHLSSEILIMDEVLAVGDMQFQQKCMQKLLEIATQQQRTILYVSHNMATIRQLCNRAIVLKNGRLIFDGETDDAVAAYLQHEQADKTSLDYTIMPPGRHPVLQQDVTLIRAWYPTGSVQCSDDEKLVLSIQVRANRPITDLCLRITFYDAEKRPLATAVLLNFCSLQENEEKISTLGFDLSAFAEGSYETRYTLFTKSGAIRDLESRPGLLIKKRIARDTQKLKWYSRVWGSINLPPPDIIS